MHDLSSLPVVTVNGVEYYRFDWRLDVNKDGTYGYEEDVEIVDTLPSGMILYENNDYLKYSTGGSSSTSQLTTTPWYQFRYSYDKGTNKINLVKRDIALHIGRSITAPL